MHEEITEHIYHERGKAAKHVTSEWDNAELKIQQAMTRELDHVLLQLEELLYMIGDQPDTPTEDELMNYVIGIIESVKVKKTKMKVAHKV